MHVAVGDAVEVSVGVPSAADPCRAGQAVVAARKAGLFMPAAIARSSDTRLRPDSHLRPIPTYARSLSDLAAAACAHSDEKSVMLERTYSGAAVVLREGCQHAAAVRQHVALGCSLTVATSRGGMREGHLLRGGRKARQSSEGSFFFFEGWRRLEPPSRPQGETLQTSGQ